ncbi:MULTISPECIES: MCE family protein [Gordonia]|jgi:phospholipid/cholesterol/gamma-HCH transport system substrate-binding protein|uniref:Mce family protein n=1 Tax=Gordonia malaquae NBRC 108250 TaxID=1223542 RepID=M3TCV6_GORML|nr:MCE family protein [Gordonia malaquae]GAC79231.1 Mce family protein [Gordonia malaquae NBRC 108250]SEE03497.1 virulence factor Mce family protein [Gordonia malaquae]
MTTADNESGVFNKRNIVFGALGTILVLILGTAGWWASTLVGTTTVHATFSSAVGIYEGSNVRVLGVDVGKVTKVTPNGDVVDVDMRVNRGVQLPKDVGAVQIIPSIVADRYIQLTPAFDGGAEADSEIRLGTDKTRVPVEIDAIYKNLQKLSVSLGPDGANKNGAVTDFVSTAAKNLDGNGAKLGEAITNLSKAATTLSDGRGDLSSTISNLNVFVGALRENDSQVRQFNTQMASFNQFMAGERNQLGKALDTLSYALGDVATFISDNNDRLGKAIRGLQPTGQALLDNKDHLLEIFTVLPVTISNLINAYDAESGTLAMRLNLTDLQDPLAAQCRFLDLKNLMPGNPLAIDFSKKMAPLINGCKDLSKQITSGVLEPMLPILPFGILSAKKQQQNPAPGTNSGNPDPRLPGGK